MREDRPIFKIVTRFSRTNMYSVGREIFRYSRASATVKGGGGRTVAFAEGAFISISFGEHRLTLEPDWVPVTSGAMPNGR
jgi:hypothetical protein